MKASQTEKNNNIVHRYAYNSAIEANEKTLHIKKRTNRKTQFVYEKSLDFSKEQRRIEQSIRNFNSNPSNRFIQCNEDGSVLGDMANWMNYIDTTIVRTVNIDDIVLIEKIHLKCREINLQGQLNRYSKKEVIEKPIAVRRISDKPQYALVVGLSRYIVAKVLGMKTIPVYMTELDYAGFVNKYDI